MMKLVIPRAILPGILVAISLLVTACEGAGVPAPTPVANTPAANTQPSVAPDAAGQGTNTPTGDILAGTNPVDLTALPTDIANGEATASALIDQYSSANPTPVELDLTKLDPCSYLKADDVKSEMGDVPFAPKPQTQESYHTACSYVEPTLEVNSPRLFLSLDDVEAWQFDVDMTDSQPVSGVGDAAQTRNFDGWRSLWVLVKNKVVVGIDIYPPDLEKAKQLASTVIKQLP